MDRTLRLVITIFLVLLLIGMMPVWPYASGWRFGWYPTGGLALVLIVIVVIGLMGADRPGSRPRL
ncbi:MAG: DUF3309 domain-containing protein [Tepidisphaera sp.]